MKCPLMAFPTSEGIPLLATSAVTIPPGSQTILDSQILYELPKRTFLELYSPPLLVRNKPYLCPGILDISHKDPVKLLISNLTACDRFRKFMLASSLSWSDSLTV
ncbi:hypothetical protein DSO57_1037314 [Entomophthora muscae]|uniref:Uncharacterized protein n=1 Tax=Entomophthora muscae TaxID=34485 RepID=A0ACC2TKX0_9FUNG|nr:hypothetical protein DSO57_1037314 [Entomophthora muscae]